MEKVFELKFTSDSDELIEFTDKSVTLPEMEVKMLVGLLQFAASITPNMLEVIEISETIRQLEDFNVNEQIDFQVSKKEVKWFMKGFSASINQPMREKWRDKCLNIMKQLCKFEKEC